LPETRLDDPKLQPRSNAYEVGLIEEAHLSKDGSGFFIDDGNLDDLSIIEPQPLVIKIDLGGGNFANITAQKNSNPAQLASKFCHEYQLPEAIIDPLCNRI